MPSKARASEAPKEEPTTAVATGDGYSTEDLRAVTSIEDALQLAAREHGGVVEASGEVGDGFTLLDKDEKMRLVGVPLLFLEWQFNPGDYGGNFVSARVFQFGEQGGIAGRFIINDGSTGIYETLREYTERTGRTGGLLVKRGLRASTYNLDENNEPLPKNADPALIKGKATTYYLDTSS